jgi:hypothetical protein
MRNHAFIAGKRCARALSWCLFAPALFVGATGAATLAEKARESGCVNKPTPVQDTLYRCSTESGAFSYFNVPGISGEIRGGTSGNAGSGTTRGKSAATPSPAGFPKVDAETQKGRDDMRRKVLAEELSAEEKLLTEARSTYANGAPIPLPEETANAGKYRERIARLRQAVQLHERNIEALRKELGNTR